MKNKMEDLRNHLFAELERLGADDRVPGPDELARAKAISEVAQTLINSAKVEVEYLNLVGAKANSPFIDGNSPRQLTAVK